MTQAIFNFPTPFTAKPRKSQVEIIPVRERDYKTWRAKQSAAIQTQAKQEDFTPKAGQTLIISDKSGALQKVFAGVHNEIEIYDLSYTAACLKNKLSKDALAKISFTLKTTGLKDHELQNALIGWGLAGYSFDTYKSESKPAPTLLWPDKADRSSVLAYIEALSLTRNLVNTPPNDMGPAELEKAARDIAAKFKAKINVIQDKDLLKKNFPMVYAVGDSSPRRPRLIELSWGKASHPKLTLVGKGVCFDTGGLDLKPPVHMKLMKKDMGGAAHVLGLAWLIMAHKIPVKLTVLIPAVENAVSGTSFRPGDVFKSRKGITIENTDTDAEGRLILSDCLTYASESNPDLIMDFATLTGSARAALGPDIPAMFASKDKTAQMFQNISFKVQDPVWRMPLWQKYKDTIKGSTSDIINSAGVPGDLIYSAIFLQSFLEGTPDWLHLDIYAWELNGHPGRPKGGADSALRASFALIEKRYGRA